jgi:uncharacterized protein YndB with AHSA1/START domain
VIDEHGDVVHDVRLPHAIERVWNAISNRDELGQWLMGNDFEPVIGHRFHFDAGPPRGRIAAEVLALDPPTRLSDEQGPKFDTGWVEKLESLTTLLPTVEPEEQPCSTPASRNRPNTSTHARSFDSPRST